MSLAGVFLACFLGCLFANVMLSLALVQFRGWNIRRMMRHARKGTFDPVTGTFDTNAPAVPAHLAPRAAVRVATAHCDECHATQGITDNEAGISILNGLGWRRTDTALFCVTCAPHQLGAREIEAPPHDLTKPVRMSFVTCDECGVRSRFDGNVSPKEATAKFQAEGWRIGSCMCPSCTAKTRDGEVVA